MRSILKKVVSSTVFSLTLASYGYSWEYSDNGYYTSDYSNDFASEEYFDSCCNPCDPCCPLKPCSFNLQVKGGWEPGYYTDRTHTWINAPVNGIELTRGPRIGQMHDQMRGPWQIGLEAGYNVNCNVMFFAEVNYFKGDKKNNSINIVLDNLGVVVPATEKFQGQEGWNGYIGARYFFDRSWFCDRVAPFVGAKIGFTHYNKLICFPTLENGVRIDRIVYFKSSTEVSAGVQIGLDWEICNNFHGIFTAELVATGARKNNLNDRADPIQSGGVFNNVIGQTGTIINFPLTIGLRYDF